MSQNIRLSIPLPLAYVAVQGGLFFLLAAAVMRLKLLAVPMLICLAALCITPLPLQLLLSLIRLLSLSTHTASTPPSGPTTTSVFPAASTSASATGSAEVSANTSGKQSAEATVATSPSPATTTPTRRQPVSKRSAATKAQRVANYTAVNASAKGKNRDSRVSGMAVVLGVAVLALAAVQGMQNIRKALAREGEFNQPELLAAVTHIRQSAAADDIYAGELDRKVGRWGKVWGEVGRGVVVKRRSKR